MNLSFADKLISIRDLALTEDDLNGVSDEFREIALRNMCDFEAVAFEYEANGRKYDGFYARRKDLSEKEKHPIVIVNRGGTALFGQVTAKSLFFGPYTHLIAAGYIVIGSQCMGFAKDGAIDEMGGEDFRSVLALKGFIDMDVRADSGRIGVYGASRGAIATFRLLAEVKWLRAAVVVSGLVDLTETNFRPEMKEHYAKIFGGSMEECIKRSALSWPEKLPKNAPILLMYGTADWRVNPRTGLFLSEKMFDLKIPHRLVMFEGSDHSLSEHWQESKSMCIAWLDRFVRNESALPDMIPHGK